MLIKIFLLLAVCLVAAGLMKSRVSDRNIALRRVAIALLSIIAVFFILWPELASQIAHLVGVGRGTDLLFYLVTVGFLASLVTAAKRRAILDRKITMLARELALMLATRPDEPDVTSKEPQA